jgi:hypothetical protein
MTSFSSICLANRVCFDVALYLPQDMGQDYTEAEIGLTACYLDPDNVGTVGFDEFVRWWCE